MYKQLRFKQGEITMMELTEAKQLRQLLNDHGFDTDPVTIVLALRHFPNLYQATFWNSNSLKHREKQVEALLSVLEIVPETADAPVDNARYKNKRAAIFDFVVQFKREHNGIAPSIREIQQALDISSTNIVTYHLDRLAQEGLIQIPLGAGKTRAIAVPGYEFRKVEEC